MWLTPAAPARRTARVTVPIMLPLDHADRQFLLCRLADIGATAEAIVHNPPPLQIAPPWPRKQVVVHIEGVVHALRNGCAELRIIGKLGARVITEAIEGNPYFARMADDDPRLCAAAIRRADALRLRIARAIGTPIGPVPLGSGRQRGGGGA
jgi:hypothetical protein